MNDKGFTLMELILAMALSTIVIGIVISLLVFNSKSYTSASDEVNLQMESQTVMNQLNDMIMEAEWVKLIDVDTDPDSGVKALLIYPPSENPDVIFLKKADKSMYFVENVPYAGDSAQLKNIAENNCSKKENIMASNVTDITIYPSDDTDLIAKKQITLHLNFTNRSSDYSSEQNIMFRNKLAQK